MNISKNIWLILLASVLLGSCELLGIGGGDDKREEPPRPELIWEDAFYSNSNNNPAPIIEDSSLYAAGGFGLARLAVADGQTSWTSGFETLTRAVRMLVDEENIYLRCEHSLKTFSKVDGTLLWNTGLEDTLRADRLVAGTSLIDQSETRLLVGSGGELLIVNKRLGTIEATVMPELPAEAGASEVLHSPLVSESGNRFYLLSSYMDHSGTAQGRVAAYNLADRSLLWQYDLPFPLPHIVEFLLPTMQMTEVENNLLVMTGPAVVALDAQSGKEIWRYLFYEGRTDIDVGNFLVYNNGSVYAGADSRILKLDPSNGRKEWEAEAGGLIDRLVAGDDNLYFSSSLTFSATIYSIDAETGEVKYQLNSPDSGVLGGFTSAFDVSNNYLVNIGRMKMYGYRLPD